MNVFILNTGRCGSTTFIKACEHITNFSSAHESLSTHVGINRFAYPTRHIEADNRLSWFLGRLDSIYGNDAFYVHLNRDKQKTIDSFSKREEYGIMKAYKEGILLGGKKEQSAIEIAEDYVDTIEFNIELFLKDKTSKMNFSLENAVHDFDMFYKKIAAKGNLQAALNEFTINYNAS
ncbi:MAG: hypothetical protein DIZ80_13545 [endosymbiont of Galathealinum brachiosum]|uniref:Sulfotransferase family protein n=1 Tax=endosymbiont of Galathealinum brachiosum TaxID=2200906 RepID=A0A370D890_9GAMM|nr:MAG: hypothetical protein DIZ80_13545 [endosymbiont of Galathealinum brachiosum]